MISNSFTVKPTDQRALNGMNLGDHLGSRDPAHIRRWVAAQVAARRNLPKCDAIAAGTGMRCRLLPLRGSTCCLRHSKGKQLDAAGRILAAEAIDFVHNGGSPVQVHRANRTLARIARRNLHQLWLSDPRIVGSTLALDERTEAKVWEWLKENCRVAGLDKKLPNFDRQPTQRCVDRMRWAAYRALRYGANITDDFIQRARHRVASAINDDRKFWKRLAKLEAFDASQEWR